MNSKRLLFLNGTAFSGIIRVSMGLILLFGAPLTVQAAGPWYVSEEGNDSNSCTSPGSACLSINSALGKAAPGDTIFVASGTYIGTGSEVVSIIKDGTLSGGWNAGFTTQNGTTIIDGQDARRGIKVEQGVSVIIERFTIRSGRGDSVGGIWNDGSLTLNDSTVSDNVDIGDWTSEGGGIRNSGQGNLNLNNSTIKDNESSSGGGIFNAWGTITINNSTISGNSARGFGGGINNLGGSAYLNNVTISNNTDNDIVAGGIHNEGGGSVYLQNSIIAKNNGDGPDCNGTLTSYGYNLIGNMSGCTLTPTSGDLTNMDPLLNTLGNNGGPTLTHALQFGSPAINSGNPGGCKDSFDGILNLDQRGYPRVQQCDIGAYEFQAEISEQFLPLVLIPFGHADNFNDDILDTGYWTKYDGEPGVSVEETGGEIKISGTSSNSAWAWSGLSTPIILEDDFQVSIDYKLVNMTDKPQRADLRIFFNNGTVDFRVGFWDPDDAYTVGYSDSAGFHPIAGIPAFGDEGTAFHMLRIVFDSSTNTAQGYVDQVLLGSFTSSTFTEPKFVVFEQSANIAGKFNVDCRFDNFNLAAK
jgi:hypothetical protein